MIVNMLIAFVSLLFEHPVHFSRLNFRELQVETYFEFRCQMVVPTEEEVVLGEEPPRVARETTKCTTISLKNELCVNVLVGLCSLGILSTKQTVMM